MCQLFLACTLSCPSYKTLWHPLLLTCSTASPSKLHPSTIQPCTTLTTLHNEDLCPHCLTAQLRKHASKYVKDALRKWPLRYTPVYVGGRWAMRWVGRAREEWEIEARMEGRPRGGSAPECCAGKKECMCYGGGAGSARQVSNGEWLAGKARVRNSERYFGRDAQPTYGKETHYTCTPKAKREEVETVYTCKPTERRRETETYYTCKPTGARETYYGKEGGRERVFGERERERRGGATRTYRRGGYDIDVEVDVGEKRSSRKTSSGRRKSVSFADDGYYYGYC